MTTSIESHSHAAYGGISCALGRESSNDFDEHEPTERAEGEEGSGVVCALGMDCGVELEPRRGVKERLREDVDVLATAAGALELCNLTY